MRLSLSVFSSGRSLKEVFLPGRAAIASDLIMSGKAHFEQQLKIKDC